MKKILICSIGLLFLLSCGDSKVYTTENKVLVKNTVLGVDTDITFPKDTKVLNIEQVSDGEAWITIEMYNNVYLYHCRNMHTNGAVESITLLLNYNKKK